MGADIKAFWIPSLRVSGAVTAILRAATRQKVDKFEPVYLGN